LNNLYYQKIKTWTNFIFALSVIIITSNIGIAFTKDRDFWMNCLTVFMSFYLLLLILKRPVFLNTSAKKIAFGHKFNIEEESEINEFIFQNLFLEQKYFTKKDASLEGLASLMEVHPTRIADYIVKTYDMTFGELVNKNRVNYFFEIVQNPAFQNFTIDALAREVGFSSRQHLNKPFKKFHGGNPSDLLSIHTTE
jgi:AraC-like DNA-binding protein